MINKLREPTEHEIQTQLMNYLTFIGIYNWRNNSGMTVVGEGRSRRMIRMGTAGMPDIMGVIGKRVADGRYYGRLIGIGVKKPKNKPTSVQLTVHQELQRFGATVWVIHSLEELKQKIEELYV